MIPTKMIAILSKRANVVPTGQESSWLQQRSHPMSAARSDQREIVPGGKKRGMTWFGNCFIQISANKDHMSDNWLSLFALQSDNLPIVQAWCWKNLASTCTVTRRETSLTFWALYFNLPVVSRRWSSTCESSSVRVQKNGNHWKGLSTEDRMRTFFRSDPTWCGFRARERRLRSTGFGRRALFEFGTFFIRHGQGSGLCLSFSELFAIFHQRCWDRRCHDCNVNLEV